VLRCEAKSKIAQLLERKQTLLERKQEEPDLKQVAEIERDLKIDLDLTSSKKEKWTHHQLILRRRTMRCHRIP
jgi:hypothetical protein